jgi:hypothetical protein
MNLFIKQILTLLVVANIFACGGDSKPTSEAKKNIQTIIQGTAIDGYIVGGTMFMDINFNSIHDSDEPSVITVEPTAEQAGWELVVPSEFEKCRKYIPLVIYVPVGAIDLDEPDTPIKKAYNLVFPPEFAISTDSTLKNVTPLTTILWNVVKKEFDVDKKQLTCESIVADQELREKIKKRLRIQEQNVAHRYNVTIDTLYRDFIADGNTQLHGLAQSLVVGLVASYEETILLERANPDALLAYVEYFFNTPADILAEKWSRTELVFDEELYKEVTYDMHGIGEFDTLVEKIESHMATVDDVNTRTIISFKVYNDYKDYEYSGTCSISESFISDYSKNIDNIRYSVNNVSVREYASGWQECMDVDRVTENREQILSATQTRDSDSGETFIGVEYWYREDNPNLLSHMIGASIDDFSGNWLENNLSYISLDFNDTTAHGADWWRRVKVEYSPATEGGRRSYISILHDMTDYFRVTKGALDGTRTEQCGLWSVGADSLTDNCD